MKFRLLLIATLFSITLFAQEKTEEAKSPWSYKGITGLNFSQTSFTNWSEGGENSVAGNVYLNASLNYVHNKVSWTNDLSTNFGMYYTTENNWRKNIDNINFASKYGRSISKALYYAALLDFKTQFANGYNYAVSTTDRVSGFMTPAYLNLSVGVDYKPNEHFSAYYSPVTGKMTFVSDTTFSTNYGLQAGKKNRAELGSSFRASANYDIFKVVNLKSSLDLFTAYNQSFGKIDVNWEVELNLKVTELLTVTFQSTLRFDDDIKYVDANGVLGPARVQFKEVLGVGLSYKF